MHVYIFVYLYAYANSVFVLLQASGEALYSSDAPIAARELCGALVLCPDGCVGRSLLNLNWTATFASPGVVDVLTAADFPSAAANAAANDDTNTTPHYLLPLGEAVPCVGAPIALVLADTLAHARRGAQLAALQFSKRALEHQGITTSICM